jgi:hypothetical protein
MVQVTISEKGLDLLRQIDPEIVSWIDGCFSTLDEVELRTLSALLEKARASLCRPAAERG